MRLQRLRCVNHSPLIRGEHMGKSQLQQYFRKMQDFFVILKRRHILSFKAHQGIILHNPIKLLLELSIQSRGLCLQQYAALHALPQIAAFLHKILLGFISGPEAIPRSRVLPLLQIA